MQLTARNAVNSIQIQQVQDLYNRYAGMLLGFILEIVINTDKAEQCLTCVFKELPHHLDDLRNSQLSEFCFLQRITRKKAMNYIDSQAVAGVPLALKKYADRLSDEHLRVFHGTHYLCKTTAMLALELNKTEAEIRLLLKQAFDKIRKGERV
jgi:DNA-directed RNA polymerase specialized sigma24 family protein